MEVGGRENWRGDLSGGKEGRGGEIDSGWAEAVTFMFNIAGDATSRVQEMPLCLHKYARV